MGGKTQSSRVTPSDHFLLPLSHPHPLLHVPDPHPSVLAVARAQSDLTAPPMAKWFTQHKIATSEAPTSSANTAPGEARQSIDSCFVKAGEERQEILLRRVKAEVRQPTPYYVSPPPSFLHLQTQAPQQMWEQATGWQWMPSHPLLRTHSGPQLNLICPHHAGVITEPEEQADGPLSQCLWSPY